MEEPSLREAEVLELVGSHLSNPQIANRLYISVRTVESHIAALIRKLGVEDRRALVAYAAAANHPATGGPDSRARHNLPLPRSSFIGRTAERAQLRQMVLSGALVTLTGIGGCGKTRLAREVALDLEGDFGDGVFFVDLSAVTDPTLVGQAVASSLGLQIVDPTADSLAEYFAERETLLLFDNCEHLLDACADLADALAGERCPRLRILATSREPLGIDGERSFRVPSLAIETEAVALFVERALSARLDMQIDAQGEVAVAEICRRLDGIPLAIELAASQVAYLSLTEILERLNDRFRLLVGGRRRIQRQQTLIAALDWSYDLLGPDEQLLLGRLAVFRGSFSLRAAEAICHPRAMELLRSLVAKSLVSITDDGGRVRYWLLESVRIYAEGKLVETGESEQLRSTHRDFYLEWIESVPLDWMASGSSLGAALLAPEADNLAAALEWCRQQGRYELCARIAVRMGGYWHSFLRVSEMMAWSRDVDAGLPAEDRDHRAMALLLRIRAAALAGQLEEALAASDEACALADPHGWVGAEALLRRAVYWSAVDPARNLPLVEEAFQIKASMGLSPDPMNYQFFYLARLRLASGRDDALAVLGEWLADLGDSTPPPVMAAAFALYGEVQTALELESRAETAAPAPIIRFQEELSRAVLASTQGHFDQAERHLATMASVVRDFAVPGGEAACLIGFAKVALDRGDFAATSRLLAAVDSSTGPGDGTFRQFGPLLYAHCTGLLQDVLDPESARRAEAEGRALSLRQALDAELTRSETTAMANPVD